MPAVGFYFPSYMSKEDVNALRGRLNAVAAEFGYTASRGRTAGQGNLAEMLMCIDAGELILFLLPPEQRQWLLEWIEDEILPTVPQDSVRSIGISDALSVLAERIRDANIRQAEVDQAEIDDYDD